MKRSRAGRATISNWTAPHEQQIPDFIEAAKHVSASLFERYGKLIPFQLAGSEL